MWSGGHRLDLGFNFSTSSLSSLNIFIDNGLELAFISRMHVLLRGFIFEERMSLDIVSNPRLMFNFGGGSKKLPLSL